MNRFIFSYRQVKASVCAVVVMLLVTSCSGDPRPLEEAVEVSNIGLTRLVIESGITLTEDIYINPSEQLKFDFTAYDAAAVELDVENTNRRWSVSDGNIASITDSGLLTGVANGRVDVSINIGGIVAPPVTVFVSDAELASIDNITGPASLIECSRSEAYNALGTFTDSSERELQAVTWSLADPDSGILLDASGESVVVGSLNPGSITLQAEEAGVSGSVIIDVSAGVESFVIVPDPLTVERSATTSLVARATYSSQDDGTTVTGATVSALASWSLEQDNGVAAITQVAGETGVLAGVTIGTNSVVAQCGDQLASVVLTVIEPVTITSLEIVASDDPLVLNLSGSGEQLEVFARSEGGSNENQTSSASWRIIRGEDVLAVEDSGSNRGFVTPLRVGTAEVEASYRGSTDVLRVTVR